MTEDYVERRRAYVTEVRNSFDEESMESVSDDIRHQTGEHSVLFVKIRLFLAILLLGLFVAFRFSGISIKGYIAEDVIDMIEDNQYYTKLMEYIRINENMP